MRLTIIQGALAEAAVIVEDDVPPPIERDPEEAKILRLLQPHRPPNRSICENGVRPCPYVSCRYHLYLDVRGDGVLRINFPEREPEELMASCALDMSEDGPRTLDQVAALMGMSKERARQIEASAFAKLRVALGSREYDDLDAGF
jgi:hypothetical protein